MCSVCYAKSTMKWVPVESIWVSSWTVTPDLDALMFLGASVATALGSREI